MYSSVASPDVSLSSAQAEALHNVNVRLAGGIHGYEYDLPGEGLVTLGVDDTEYSRMAHIVGGLDPKRGDVFASETMGYAEPWLAGFVGDMRTLDSRSPHLQTKDFEGAINLEPEALARYMQRARDLRIISPLHYGQGIAAANGVPVEYADATEAEMLSRSDSPIHPENVRFRDGRIVHRLGDIAMGMSGAVERPTLLFAGGANHMRGVGRLLNAHGIPYQRASFSSPRRMLLSPLEHMQARLHIASERLHVATNGAAPHIVRSPVDRHIRQWERNFQTQHAR